MTWARRPCYEMRRRRSDIPIHLALIAIAAMTLLPFLFVVNNSLRRSSEQNYSFFGPPGAVTNAIKFTWFKLTGQSDRIRLRPVRVEAVKPTAGRAADVAAEKVAYADAMKRCYRELTFGFAYTWKIFRPYMLNSIIVSLSSAL